MSNRSAKYLAAAQLYTARNGSASPDPCIQEILDFIKGEEWYPALSLLQASGKRIQVGYDKGALQSGYFLGGTGFFLTYNRDGVDVVKKIITNPIFAHDQNTGELAEVFHNRFPNETSFTEFILRELDRIAEASHRQ